jgi:hypothetical protein
MTSHQAKLQEELSLIDQLLDPERKLDSGTCIRLKAKRQEVMAKLNKVKRSPAHSK